MGVLDNLIFGFPTWQILVVMMGVLLPIVIVMIVLLRRGEDSPIEENNALIIPEDEQGTIQEGSLVGNVQRTEEKLLITNPEWKDDDGNVYTGELDLTSGGGTKIALPYRDAGGRGSKKLWFILDRGDLTVASITTLLHGLPKRWDPPLADRRKTIRFLVSSHPGQSITNALTTPTGIVVSIGLVGGGMLLAFFLVTVSGHLH